VSVNEQYLNKKGNRYDQFAFWLKKAQKWGKRRMPDVKIKMHTHSMLSEKRSFVLPYLRIYVALAALMWHFHKIFKQNKLQRKVTRATYF